MKLPRPNLLTLAIMCFTAAAVALVLLLSGCATTKPGRVADAGAHADHGTTAYGLLAMGATELNPLAPLGPLRYWAVRHAEGYRCEDGGRVIRTASAVGWGAGAWNVLMLTVSPVAAAVAGLMGGLGGYQLAQCEPIPASPEQLELLARWERAYESGDAAAIRGLLTDAELAERYRKMFSRTVIRDAEYRRVEAVRGGFVAEYEVRVVYDDGTDRVLAGDLKFTTADDGRIEGVAAL